MSEMEEYQLNGMRINGIKNTLMACGFQYDDVHKWYLPDGVRLRQDQKDYFENAKPLFERLVKRNNELKKKLGL